MDKVIASIVAVYAEKPSSEHPRKATLWDLLTLEKYNGGPGEYSDRGKVLSTLDARTLRKLRDWLDKNAERAIRKSSHLRWQDVRTAVWLELLRSNTNTQPGKVEGLPIRAVAVRADGKRWDLNIPIRRELLRLSRRYYSERDIARILAIPRTTYNDMRKRMEEQGFTLKRFTTDVLFTIVHGQKRGRPPKPPR